MRLDLFLSVLILAAVASTATAKTVVYVSVSGEQSVIAHSLDDSGNLSVINKTELSGGPGSLALHPTGNFLYASVRGTGHLAAMHVGDDGGLVVINETPVDADPSYVAIDPDGKYVISAYYRAGKVMVHAIGKDGSLSSQPVQTIQTDEKAHAVVRDPSGKFVFVPHTGPNAIFQFRFDPTSGKLVANDPPKLVRKGVAGPRHLWFHPKLSFAFGSDEQGSSITSYEMDSKGLLSAKQTLSTLPEGYSQKNSTSDIEVHPSGKYVYVANRGHDSIAGFAIDAAGKLKSLGTTPTERTPRSFNISPDGRHLIAAGQNSGRLAIYKINDDGSLKQFATTEVGSKPWWVLITER